MRKSHDIQETREMVYARDYYQCQYPGCHVVGYDNLQMAHRIAKTNANRDYVIGYIGDRYGIFLTKKEAMGILNNIDNLVTSCATHNAYFNIGNNPVERDSLIDNIFEKFVDRAVWLF